MEGELVGFKDGWIRCLEYFLFYFLSYLVIYKGRYFIFVYFRFGCGLFFIFYFYFWVLDIVTMMFWVFIF